MLLRLEDPFSSSFSAIPVEIISVGARDKAMPEERDQYP